MKPSLRRDSLEKAARKAWENSSKNLNQPANLVPFLVRFAQRHGAKVRRETLKEAAKIASGYDRNGKLLERHDAGNGDYLAREILALTPRGPEKGRTK